MAFELQAYSAIPLFSANTTETGLWNCFQ